MIAPAGGDRRDRMLIALADELVEASRILGELAYDLGSDDETLRRHMESLQTIDMVTQIQLTVADLIRDPALDRRSIDGVGLEAMANRLEAIDRRS